MAKTAASQVIQQPDYLPHLMGATPNSVLEHLLKDLNRVADPVTGKVRPKVETGQPVAQSRTERDEIYSQIDNVYDREAEESTANRYRGGGVGYGPDNIVVAQDAATVGQDQGWVRAMLANPRFNNDELFKDIALTKEQELAHLQNFARLWGVNPKEVATDPSLYQAFGRYMGKMEGKASADKYFGYNLRGERDKAQDRIVGEPDKEGNYAITPWVTPQHVFENSGVGTSVQDMALAQGYRLNEEQFMARELARGLTQNEAEAAWDKYQNIETTASIIEENLDVINEKAFTKVDILVDGRPGFKKADTRKVASRMGDKFYNVFNNYMRSISLGPKELSRFVQKFKAKDDQISLESASELMLTLVGTHAAMQENVPEIGRAWSDIMMLAVLHHSLRNVWRYHEQKDSDVDTDESIDAEERFQRSLMTGSADDRHIGKSILDNMGFDRSTRSQNTLMGAIARAMVSDTFKEDWGNKDETALWDKKLFEEVRTDEKRLDETRGEHTRTMLGFTLTQDGLNLAQDLEPLFSTVLPLSDRDVRYTQKWITEAEIRKLKKLVSRRTGEKVSTGEMDALTEAINHMQNVPVRIYTPFMNFLRDIASLVQDPENGRAQEILNGSKYLNIKGHGKNYKGVFNTRPGFVFSMDRQGNLLNKEGQIVDSFDEAERLVDHSDKVKDAQLLKTLDFALRNVGTNGESKAFYYDYFIGLATRTHVDQTIGNYQHNKIARAMIEAGVPNNYDLNDIYDVISYKAGIMKRYGYDGADPIHAANLFDSNINKWMRMTNLEIFAEGGTAEGWASATAILEAREFQQALNQPGKATYTSGFFTEIDGKTNGMAWSAAQAGSSLTSAGAFVFTEQDFKVWADNYETIESFQETGDIAGLREFASSKGLDPDHFDKYLDAYNKVNDSMGDRFKTLRRSAPSADPENPFQNFPGQIQDTASFNFKAILKKADRENFLTALDIFGEEVLGRSFVKKPVMIFGYGAGEDMILLTVKDFIDSDLIQRDTVRDALNEAGIDIDVDFIEPLGVMVAESIAGDFKQIKDFGKSLSLAATEAEAQGFSLIIPTSDGHKINLGSTINELTGQRRRATFPSGSPSRERGTVDSRMMETEFDEFAGRWVDERKVLKAATSISVMLNHANDNINMLRALVRKHRAKLIEKGLDPDAQTPQTGGTALHIFDAVLVTPKEAEAYADTLNDIFLKMNANPDFGHAEAVAFALTYDLNNHGDRKLDPHVDKRIDKDGNLITEKPTAQALERYQYKRRLKPDGIARANEEGNEISTHSPILDQYAFNWRVPDETTTYYDKNKKKRTRKIKHSATLSLELAKIRKARTDLMEEIKHIKQFFYSTRPLEQQIANSKVDLSNHKKGNLKAQEGQPPPPPINEDFDIF